MKLKAIIKLVYGRGVNCNEQPFDWSDEKVIKEAVQAVKDRVREVMPKKKEVNKDMACVSCIRDGCPEIVWSKCDKRRKKYCPEWGFNQYHTEMDKRVEEL